MSFHDRTYLIGISIDDAGETITHAVIRRSLGPWAGPWPGGAVVALERERAGADLRPAIDRYHERLDRGDQWDRDAAFIFDCGSYVHGRALVDAWQRSRCRKLRIAADFLLVSQEENRNRVRGIGRIPWQQLLEVASLLRRQDRFKVAPLPLAPELEQQFLAARQRPLRADQDGYEGTDLLRTVALPIFRAHVDASAVGRIVPARYAAAPAP